MPVRRACLRATLPVLAACVATAADADAAKPSPPGALSCLGCHAASESGESGTPASLATLSPDQIAVALAAYRSGKRDGTIMPRIAAGFSEAEARAIAAALGRPAKAAP